MGILLNAKNKKAEFDQKQFFGSLIAELSRKIDFLSQKLEKLSHLDLLVQHSETMQRNMGELMIPKEDPGREDLRRFMAESRDFMKGEGSFKVNEPPTLDQRPKSLGDVGVYIRRKYPQSVYGEAPGGTKNGVNTTFTVKRIPVWDRDNNNTLMVYIGGARQTRNTDYTISNGSRTFEFTVAPLAADVILCDYEY